MESLLNDNFRHEYKYICANTDLMVIDNRIRGLVQPDSHVGPNGKYVVRSLYFDDFMNTCFYENENGTDPREKYRIRIYNGDKSRIALECKRKVRGKTQKLSCLISEEECLRLMRGVYSPILTDTPPLLAKLYVQMQTRLLAPIVIVEYTRTPFIYPEGNVRITFDCDISSSNCVTDFLLPQIPTRPVMPAGKQLLEVKWDTFIPDPVFHSTGIDSLHRTAFSKYYLCRKFSLYGGITL